MKIREIILDFTSLLDIFMLILFFFILFSHFEVEEAKETANQVLEEAAAVSESLEGQFQQAEEKLQQVEDELALLEEVSHGKAVDMTALMEISRGTMIQSRLNMNASGDSWELSLKRLDDKTKKEISLASLTEQDNLSKELSVILINQHYDTEDKIPFLFLYDGTQIGSEAACNAVNAAFREVRQTYPHFYCMQLDISDFGTLEENIP